MGSFSETEGGKEALPESRQSFEVTAARAFGLVNVAMFSLVKPVFSSANIRLKTSGWSQLSPLYQAHGH